MKISRHPDGSKATEITVTETDDTDMTLQGDTKITSRHRNTGVISDVAIISQTGGMDFNERPSVGGVDVALATDGEGTLDTTERTITDNTTTLVVLCPVQEMVSVLYSLTNAGTNEKGFLTITKLVTGFTVAREQHAQDGYFSDIDFNVTESNGALLLNVIGNGTGLITDFKYRVNSVNTLYI